MIDELTLVMYQFLLGNAWLIRQAEEEGKSLDEYQFLLGNAWREVTAAIQTIQYVSIPFR